MAILFLRPDKAGDALKTLPVLRTVRSLIKNELLHVLCSHHNASLFEFEPGLVRHELPTDWKESAPKLGIHFDKVINLACDPFPEILGLLDSIPGNKKYSTLPVEPTDPAIIRLRLPNDSPQGRDETLNIAHLVSQATHLDIVPLVSKFESAPLLTDNDLNEAQALGKKTGNWLGICPFAGTRQRTHSLNRWGYFVRFLTKRKWSRYFLFGSHDNLVSLNHLKSFSDVPERVQVCTPSSFRALAAYFKRMDAVVAVDSGPLHLVRTLRLPCLGILSGGDKQRWFSGEREKERFVRRGFFGRYPSLGLMWFYYRRWERDFFF